LHVGNIWFDDAKWKARAILDGWDSEQDRYFASLAADYETREQGQRAVEEYIKKIGACK